jgi:hypothetical protein
VQQNFSMPKAILEFNLPEEQSEFETTTNAEKYYSILWELDQYLRNSIKYASDEIPQANIDTFQMVRDELWQLLDEKNLNLDK